MSGGADSLNWPECGWLKASPLAALLTYGDKWTLACIVLLTRPHSVSLVFVTGQWGRDANEIEHSVEGNPQIFSFFHLSTMLCQRYRFYSVFMSSFSRTHQKGKMSSVVKVVVNGQKLFLFVSCMNDSWPVTFPKGSGWGFSGLGLGWGGVGWPPGRRQEV